MKERPSAQTSLDSIPRVDFKDPRIPQLASKLQQKGGVFKLPHNYYENSEGRQPNFHRGRLMQYTQHDMMNKFMFNKHQNADGRKTRSTTLQNFTSIPAF